MQLHRYAIYKAGFTTEDAEKQKKARPKPGL